jgi:hypothetical protein
MSETEDRRHQISVPLSADLQRAVEAAAKAEDRPVASWVRRVLASAVERRNETMTRLSGPAGFR